MKKIILLHFIILFTIGKSVDAQNTIGLLTYEPNRVFDGYNLIYPHNQPNVYLLNNCGEIVHVWEDEANWRPGNTAYLTEEGLLYKTKRDAAVAGDDIWAGGGGAILEIRDWDNNLVWDFTMNDSLYRLHHDFAVTPTGTIIALAWELKTLAECIDAGRDPATLAQDKLWPDWVLEIDPELDSIIWEWHSWDHLIQDFDASKANFGVVADHPERIDLNYGRPDGHPDWHHGNSLAYNSELKQIMLSIPYFDEVWIIDHTTTTAQAASSNGGFSNRGGDLMYRWGNPLTYGGDTTDQTLFFQHDAHWIGEFLEPSHPQYGKIAVFNNRAGADFSTANIFNPPWDMYKWAYPKDNDLNWDPEGFDVTFTHPTPTALYSTGLSSVQLLPNGNTLILSGRFGYSFELTPSNEIVWEYITPLRGGFPATQGDNLSVNDNLTFRMKRYPTDFAAFDGKDLSAKGWIELEPDSTFCDQLTSTVEVLDQSAYKVFPNPVSDLLTIEWDGMFYADIQIYNAIGQRIASFDKCSGGRKYLSTSGWTQGMYFITIDGQYSRKVLIQH